MKFATYLAASIGLLLLSSQVVGQEAGQPKLADVLDALGLSQASVKALSAVHEDVDGKSFFSTALSGSGTKSCASCHQPQRGYSSDEIMASTALADQRAVPSLISAGQSQFLFWDGRAVSLEAQVMEVIENPAEMNGSRLLAAKYVAEAGTATKCLVSRPLASKLANMSARALSAKNYKTSYSTLPAPQQAEVEAAYACLAHHLAQFIRAIPHPSNEWIEAAAGKGDPSKSDPASYRGAIIFAGKGRCVTCHYGPYFTDNQFHNIGVGDLRNVDISDPGRFRAVKNMTTNSYNKLAVKYYPELAAVSQFRVTEEMWGAFKTPALVDVKETGPYMHNGKYKTLDDVVRYYDKFDEAVIPPHHYNGLIVPLNLMQGELIDLKKFLESL